MKKETREMFRDLGFYSSLGFTVALSIVIGLVLGLFVDRRFGTGPWFLFIGLIFGIAAAYRNIWLAIKKSGKL